MPTTTQAEIVDLVHGIRQRLGLPLIQLMQKLEVSYQSVNRWKNGRNMPLLLALKLLEGMLRQIDARSKDLLERYFAQ